MEQVEIMALLEKYWQAETTLEEEQLLAEYFRQPVIPPGMEAIRELFEWRDDEAEVKPGADFDRRMLERIGEMEGGAGKGVLRFQFRFAAAAAVILCIGIGLLAPMLSPKPEPEIPQASTAITDTYTDPQQALAAVRQALLVASVRINEGKHITQKNIDRLHNTWQVATGQKRQL